MSFGRANREWSMRESHLPRDVIFTIGVKFCPTSAISDRSRAFIRDSGNPIDGRRRKELERGGDNWYQGYIHVNDKLAFTVSLNSCFAVW